MGGLYGEGLFFVHCIASTSEGYHHGYGYSSPEFAALAVVCSALIEFTAFNAARPEAYYS